MTTDPTPTLRALASCGDMDIVNWGIGHADGFDDRCSKCVRRLRFALEAQALQREADDAKLKRVIELERCAYDRLNLCPDHRDKATGRCIVCDGEAHGQQKARASDVSSGPQAELLQLEASRDHWREECLKESVQNDDLRAALKAHASLVQELEPYLQHTAGCLAETDTCCGQPVRDNGDGTVSCAVSADRWAGAYRCTCGLTALLRRSSTTSTEKEEVDRIGHSQPISKTHE